MSGSLTHRPPSARSASTELAAHTPRRDIQGLRAIAVGAVVAFHAGLPVPGGFVGVDVFFVVSGFVITAMLMREYERRHRLSFGVFYRRRIRRLLPALSLMVTVVLVATALLGSPFNGQQEIAALTGAGAVLAVANVVLALRTGGYFATPPEANPLLNTWSLSVEEQFYIVFPFLLAALWWVAARRGRPPTSRSGVVASVALFASASFVLCWVMSTGRWGYRLSDPATVAFYSSPTRAWEFAAGALLALLATRRQLPARASTAAFTLGLAGIVASAFLIHESAAFPGLIALVPVSATVLAIWGGAGAQGQASRLMGSRPMVLLGDMSYSWYLWHWPLIAFAILVWPDFPHVAAMAALVSLPIAWLSFRFVENPIRFDHRIVGRRLTALVAVCLGISLLASFVLLVGSKTLWGSASLLSMNEQVSAEHAWLTSECNSSVPLGQRDASCTWNADSMGRPIYLVGDSQAGMLSEAVISASRDSGRPLLLGTKGACPFIDVEVIVDGKRDDDCRTFVDNSLAWLEKEAPGTVVVNQWMAYIWLSGVGLARPGESPTFDQAEKAQAFEDGLARAVSRLRTAGHEVILVNPLPGFPAPNPDWRFWYPYQCHTVTALIDTSDCGESVTIEDARDQLSPYTALVSRVAQVNAAQILDLLPFVCRDGACSTNADNFWIYLDGQHISVGESERLAPVFAALG